MIRTFTGDTLDDLMRRVIQVLLKDGKPTAPSRGTAFELQGVGLELNNPRARLSRSEARGRIYSSLGELCWYLSASNSVEQISYYIPAYAAESENGLIHGGYGPRLLAWNGVNQLRNIVKILQNSRHSRRAVIQLFDHSDISEHHKDVPCTCTLQFLIRDEKLHAITYMRSNDAYLGLPHDIFSFTMLQEIIARELAITIGSYTHFVGSLHLYAHDKNRAADYLKEGWQTVTAMPEMPDGDPWPALQWLVAQENALRYGSEVRHDTTIHTYWADLARLLEVYTHNKNGNRPAIEQLRGNMSSGVYDIYIKGKLR